MGEYCLLLLESNLKNLLKTFKKRSKTNKMSDDESMRGSTAEDDVGHYEGDRNDDGERHGDGKATFRNGDTFEGSYEHGLRHGRGAYMWANGNAKYEGEYYRGKRNGAGRMYYPDGSMYEGNWNDNQRNGAGMTDIRTKMFTTEIGRTILDTVREPINTTVKRKRALCLQATG